MRETEDQLKVIPQFCFPDAKDWAPVDNFPRFGSECCHGTQAQSEVKANVDTGISLWSGDSSLSCFPH